MNLLDYISQMPDPNSVMGPMPVAQGPRGGVVGGGILSKFMPAPTSGLLSEADVANARKMGLLSLGASLLANSGSGQVQKGTLANLGEAVQAGLGAYQGGLGNSMKMRGAEQEHELGALRQQAVRAELDAKQRAQTQEQAILARRQELLTKFPPPQQGTPQDVAKWAAQVYPQVATGPDQEFAEHLKSLMVVGMQMSTQKPQGARVTVPGPDGKPIERFVSQAELEQGVPAYVAPKDTSTRDAIAADRVTKREMLFTDRYDKSVAPLRETHGYVTTTLQNVGAARDGNGAAQVELLNAFVKALDPQTAIREGEVELAKSAAPIWSQAKGYLDKVAKNEAVLVPPALVDQMQALLERRLKSYEKIMTEKRTYWTGRAERAGIPDADILFEEVPTYGPGQQGNRMEGVQSGGSSSAAPGRRKWTLPDGTVIE